MRHGYYKPQANGNPYKKPHIHHSPPFPTLALWLVGFSRSRSVGLSNLPKCVALAFSSRSTALALFCLFTGCWMRQPCAGIMLRAAKVLCHADGELSIPTEGVVPLPLEQLVE